jgi:putative redox protein
MPGFGVVYYNPPVSGIAEESMSKPPMTVTLTWDHALEFTGEAGKHEIGMDGATYTAPSPMQLLAFSVAGCMAIDVVHILTRGRHTLTELSTVFVGERAPEEPHRFTKIDLRFTIGTSATAEQVQRALDLSRDKYCSVWNSLRQDIEFNAGMRPAVGESDRASQ